MSETQINELLAIDGASSVGSGGSRKVVTPVKDDRSAPSRGFLASGRRLVRRPEFGALAGLVIVFVFFAVEGKNGFLTLDGTTSWVNTASEVGILAIPVGLLMIAGEFDLSVGSVVGASSLIIGIAYGYYGWPMEAAAALAIVVGLLVGLANGLLVVMTGLHSFIVTIAAQFMLAGAALGLSNTLVGTASITIQPKGWTKQLFAQQWHGFNASVLWWIAAAAIAAWILGFLPFGNWMFATGNDQVSARQTGVATGRVKILLFMSTGGVAALVGVIQAITYSSGNVTYGQSFVFAAPMIAVIGGVLLTGGYGSVVGIVMGTAIYGIVQFGVFYTGWNTNWAQFVLGFLLLLAVLGNNFFRRLAMSAGRA